MNGNNTTSLSMYVRVHPCFDEKAHFIYARVHLPVAPKCNIQCNYCERIVNENFCVDRPGVAAKLISPSEAVKLVKRAKDLYPSLSIVGIAGPGEPLANLETFETLENVHEEFPDLIKCVATNGLLLPRYVHKLWKLGVRTLTVTVNSIKPEIGRKIYSWIKCNGKTYFGFEAAKRLINAQLKGIEEAVKTGFAVKVNTVLIPEINDTHVVEVAREVARRGVYIQNIIPLIPLGFFKNRRPPTCEELETLREKCSKYIRQFHLCKMCRADALGVPGQEKSIYEKNWCSCSCHG